MNTADIIKDPFFSPFLFEIERRILGSVRSAKADGIDMNDSQIREAGGDHKQRTISPRIAPYRVPALPKLQNSVTSPSSR